MQRTDLDPSRKPRPLLAAVRSPALALIAASLAAPSGASIWSGDRWALVGTATAAAGYDSNLTYNNDGPGDYFLQVNPSLTLQRPNSTTDLRFTGSLLATEFLGGEQPRQKDFTLSALYAYPLAEKVIPTYKADAYWRQSSAPNTYLARRVKSNEAFVSAEGYVPLTGKIGLRADGDFSSVEYKEDELNSNRRARIFTGLAYQRRPGNEISFNVGYADGRSKPNRDAMVMEAVDSSEFYLTARMRGEITPKISGSAYGGFGQVRYKGGYEDRYNMPVGGADLTWGINPRRTVVLAAYSGANYTPDGQAVKTTRAFLSFTQVLATRWQYIIRGGPTRSVLSREVRQRTDNAVELGTEFAYQPSERFRTGISLTHIDQESDIRVADYTRTVVSLSTRYRF